MKDKYGAVKIAEIVYCLLCVPVSLLYTNCNPFKLWSKMIPLHRSISDDYLGMILNILAGSDKKATGHYC